MTCHNVHKNLLSSQTSALLANKAHGVQLFFWTTLNFSAESAPFGVEQQQAVLPTLCWVQPDIGLSNHSLTQSKCIHSFGVKCMKQDQIFPLEKGHWIRLVMVSYPVCFVLESRLGMQCQSKTSPILIMPFLCKGMLDKNN